MLWRKEHTVYDRMDAAATINFSVQSGAATIIESRAASIRERRLFRSERVQKFKSIIIINIVYKHKDSILALLHGISLNIDGSEDGDVHCLKDGGVADEWRLIEIPAPFSPVRIETTAIHLRRKRTRISWRRSMTAS